MSCYYISIEKNTEEFDFYKELWKIRGVEGIRADTMTEGIKKAIEIEKSKEAELYFIDIVADDIDFMPHLNVLSEVSNAPILIATSDYNEGEHHAALNNGADFYGGYCCEQERNIEAVLSALNSIERRANKKKTTNNIMIYKDLLAVIHNREVFIKNEKVSLTPREFDILSYLMKNRGNVLTYNQIYSYAWGGEYQSASRHILWNAMTRLRDKLKNAQSDCDYIETVRDYGYRFPIV